MRIAVLTVEAPNQAALCWKLTGHGELVGIVLSRNRVRRRLAQRLRLLGNRLEGRLVGRPFVRAWHDLQRRYRERYPSFPAVRTLRVANVNARQTIRFLEAGAPELVLVSGTNLIGPSLIGWADRRGIRLINLHTGLSPHVKGGPDCTNWCLAEGAFLSIGSTVLWLDAGIDSGPVLTSERTPLTGEESLLELHERVMEHAQDLCVRAVRALASGRPVPRIPQEHLAPGRTFRSAQWDGRAIRRAWRTFSRDFTPERFHDAAFRQQTAEPAVVPLDSSDDTTAGWGYQFVAGGRGRA